MSHLHFHCAITWSFLSWEKIGKWTRSQNYKDKADKDLVKDVTNKGNMI